MGCDIHLYVERKVDGKWISADKWTPDPYVEEDEEPRMTVDYDDRFYKGRNYDLFGILADVRNGRGFAGIVTGDGFKPIAMPKGLPSDVTPEVKADFDRWGSDGHSHSYLTLAELQAYDWKGQTAKHRGWVDVINFALFEKNGKPQAWSNGVSGGKVKHVGHEEMRAIVNKYRTEITAALEDDAAPMSFMQKLWDTERRSNYTVVEWEEAYAVSVKPFLTETMPKLEALSYGRPENVRIVFWFDN